MRSFAVPFLRFFEGEDGVDLAGRALAMWQCAAVRHNPMQREDWHSRWPDWRDAADPARPHTRRCSGQSARFQMPEIELLLTPRPGFDPMVRTVRAGRRFGRRTDRVWRHVVGMRLAGAVAADVKISAPMSYNVRMSCSREDGAGRAPAQPAGYHRGATDDRVKPGHDGLSGPDGLPGHDGLSARRCHGRPTLPSAHPGGNARRPAARFRG